MSVALVWFRRDLRIADNPALLAALDAAEAVIPLYIHAPAASDWPPGRASHWWLHHGLAALAETLHSLGSGLVIRQGDALTTLRQLVQETGAAQVFWNRRYEPAERAHDQAVKQALREAGLRVTTFNSALLHEPWTIQRPGGQPYRVFTPFWKAVQAKGLACPPEPVPRALPPLPVDLASEPLAALELLPSRPWDAGFYAHWTVGEAAAQRRLLAFAETRLANYAAGRDVPGQPGTSRLSPDLHFGQVSPRQIVSALHTAAGLPRPGAESYIREIAWREFAYHLLFHFPQTTDQPLDERFLRLPWRTDYAADLRRWQRGETGFPIVDAGLRELWQTGWMHNRVRMIAASLLTKNLLIPWQDGAWWFWDTLLDADLANNTLGWQWTAGCGADAAPYFRIFNPVLQGERFDPDGHYVRRWLPELARLPAQYLHQPWQAGERVLADCGVRLGSDYPAPMVDLKSSRERALAAFAAIKAYPAQA